MTLNCIIPRKINIILGLTEMKTREERGDFIKIKKIVHGLMKVNWYDENKIPRPDWKTTGRRHSYQLSHERS